VPGARPPGGGAEVDGGAEADGGDGGRRRGGVGIRDSEGLSAKSRHLFVDGGGKRDSDSQDRVRRHVFRPRRRAPRPRRAPRRHEPPESNPIPSLRLRQIQPTPSTDSLRHRPSTRFLNGLTGRYRTNPSASEGVCALAPEIRALQNKPRGLRGGLCSGAQFVPTAALDFSYAVASVGGRDVRSGKLAWKEVRMVPRRPCWARRPGGSVLHRICCTPAHTPREIPEGSCSGVPLRDATARTPENHRGLVLWRTAGRSPTRRAAREAWDRRRPSQPQPHPHPRQLTAGLPRSTRLGQVDRG
jgi:hypothetical protein